MESLCGTTYPFETSFQMDSGTGITYRNQLDCSLTVIAPSSHVVLALITRFELEAAVTGAVSNNLTLSRSTSLQIIKLNEKKKNQDFFCFVFVYLQPRVMHFFFNEIKKELNML